MKKIIAGLSLSLLCASNAFADCAQDLKTFEEGKAYILANAKGVADIAAQLNVAITKNITINNQQLFDGTIRDLDALSTQIKKNRDKFNFARTNYQKAGCGKTTAPAVTPAAGASATEQPVAPAEATTTQP